MSQHTYLTEFCVVVASGSKATHKSRVARLHSARCRRRGFQRLLLVLRHVGMGVGVGEGSPDGGWGFGEATTRAAKGVLSHSSGWQGSNTFSTGIQGVLVRPCRSVDSSRPSARLFEVLNYRGKPPNNANFSLRACWS